MIYDSFDSPLILNFIHVIEFLKKHVTYEGRILFGIRQRHDGLSSVILQLERYGGSGFNSVTDTKIERI